MGVSIFLNPIFLQFCWILHLSLYIESLPLTAFCWLDNRDLFSECKSQYFYLRYCWNPLIISLISIEVFSVQFLLRELFFHVKPFWLSSYSKGVLWTPDGECHLLERHQQWWGIQFHLPGIWLPYFFILLLHYYSTIAAGYFADLF